MAQETGTEPLAVALGRGYVTFCSVDDISNVVGIAF